MNPTQDLYGILGVPPNALSDDIRAAYRQAARRLHPDVNANPGAATQFRDIAAAHEVLGDPMAREKYDQARRKQNADTLPYFTLRVTPSKRIVPTLDEPQVLYLLAELLPERTRSAQQAESRLNLTVVIDHSTSMKGVRMERLKVAAYQLIDQLSEQDVLSVVTFSDRADVLIPSGPISDRQAAKTRVAMMQASGGTEMLQGMEAAYKEVSRHASKAFVNHIVLITDGRTYGDERQCLDLADKAAREGIGISAMGLGEEWNDVFLDQLASRTGGTSEYISSPNSVVRFLNDRVKSLGQSYAERVSLSVAPDSDIRVESAFRLTPSPQPVSTNSDPIVVGQLQAGGSASIIFQLLLPATLQPGFRSLVRLDVTADIMREQKLGYKVIADTSFEVAEQPPSEEPPLVILDALAKLTLYQMQEKAKESLARGDVHEATRRLENLATRLLASGQEGLANAAMAEARRVSHTNMLSEGGTKALKYGTRMLIAASSAGAASETTTRALPQE
jgi:Ca-activated chloride channel homolog